MINPMILGIIIMCLVMIFFVVRLIIYMGYNGWKTPKAVYDNAAKAYCEKRGLKFRAFWRPDPISTDSEGNWSFTKHELIYEKDGKVIHELKDRDEVWE